MLATLLIAMVFNRNWDQQTWNLAEFRKHKQAGEIAQDVSIRDNSIEGKANINGKTVNFVVDLHPDWAGDPEFLKELLTAEEPKLAYDYKPTSPLLAILMAMLPWVIILGVVWFLLFRQMRGAAGGGLLGSFGRSRHKLVTKERTNVTFQDVAGIEEAKEEVTELIEFLRNPGKFQRLGGRIPRGVLLIGAPGTGKTLLARAIAGEANVPFLHISGSDFVEMFVGVGASRVRDLFKQAKDASPCIIFLDEIDAVGRRRGAGFNGGGGHDEREQTLNAILVEMDGFDSNDQVIVIAATNRGDVLDPALTRPGRFDRQVYIPLPDIKGRLEILKVHARKVKLSPDVDMARLARGTGMLAGADLAAIINEAAIGATMTGKDAVELSDLEEARDKMHWGRARKSQVIDESEKRITAFHEAGHALMTHLLPEAEPLHKVSIIPRGQALGATFQLPEQDRHLWTKRRIISEIQVALAGRAAEEAFCDDISSGAAEDIRKAT
ncbi:MAG: ATP-dependent zinc metalloprotease FtsH, partial [Actinobacteria bacterium]|nr:ATP-dependent zinc metalloprotease FtsH [Actinomycetota bacterium]